MFDNKKLNDLENTSFIKIVRNKIVLFGSMTSSYFDTILDLQ